MTNRSIVFDVQEKMFGCLLTPILISLSFLVICPSAIGQNFICDSVTVTCTEVTYDQFRKNAARAASFQMTYGFSTTTEKVINLIHSTAYLAGHFIQQKTGVEDKYDLRSYPDPSSFKTIQEQRANYWHYPSHWYYPSQNQLPVFKDNIAILQNVVSMPFENLEANQDTAPLTKIGLEALFHRILGETPNPINYYEFVEGGSTNQNCHSFTCQTVGIGGANKNLWLDDIPFRIALSYNMEESRLSEVQAGDVIIFENRRTREIVHSGILTASPLGARYLSNSDINIPGLDLGGLWVKSKWGSSKVYSTTPRLVYENYAQLQKTDLHVSFYIFPD